MAPPPEPLHDIAHLGAVELLTPTPQKTLWFFRDVLGMEVVHTTTDSAWLRGYGDYAAATLKLTTADAPGVGTIAWRTSSPQALDRRAAAITEAGLGMGWSNGDFGRGRTFRCRDPEGHVWCFDQDIAELTIGEMERASDGLKITTSLA